MHLCSHWLDYGGHSSCPMAGSVLGLREGCLFQHRQDPILTQYRWWQNEFGALQLSMLKSSFEFHDPDRDVCVSLHPVKMDLGAILESEVREQSLLSAANLSFFFFLLYPVLSWEIESCHSSLALTLVWQLNLVSFVPDLDFHILPYSRPVGRPLDVHRTSWMGRSCEMAGHSIVIRVLIMVVFQGYWDLMLFFYSVLDCILKGVVSLFDL